MSPDQQASATAHLQTYPDRSGACRWIDIIRTGTAEGRREVEEELRALRAEGITLPDNLVEQMAARDARATVHFYDREHLSLVFHAIKLQDDGKELTLIPDQIDLTVGKDHLITVRNATQDAPCEALRAIWQQELPSYADGPVAFMVYRIIKAVVMDYHDELECIPELLIEIERSASLPAEELFTTDDAGQTPFQTIQQRIFTISRALLEFRKQLGPLRRVLDQLCDLAEDGDGNLPFSLKHSRIELFDLRAQVEHLIELIDTYRDIIANVIGAYQSSISNHLASVSNNMAETSNKLNANMQRLTVITAILATTAVMTGFYGMNLTGLGIASDHPYGAYIMLVSLLAAGLGMYWYFKRKGWV